MRAEARVAVIGILVLNLSVPEFVGLQQLTLQERRAALHLPAAYVPQMTAMKTGSRKTDRVIVEVRCAESDSAAKALSALPHTRAEAASAAPSMKQQP